ncbi:MAG TPA: PIN domain-containing protein [Kiritimatiellia bacterium]|nr:PIN domain-containing protein [Kiritimatiellia bacterium]
MKVLVDTNVVLDVLLDRRPHSADSAQIFRLVEEGRLQGLLCATTVTTIDYLLLQSLSRADARKHLTQLIRLFDIAAVTRAVIEGAMQSRIADFEDAVLEQAAALAGARVIITRNAKDFAPGAVDVLDPRQCLVQLGR